MKASSLLSLALALMATVGCYRSSPGVVHTSDENPLVVVGAGEIEVGTGAHYYARYIIDQRAEVCWFLAGDSVSPMECCKLASVPEAKEYLTSQDQSGCQPSSTP
jgi:hypothetical protein